ncbi:hypothetical protein GCM10010393_42250 [Streptomyces gobitricini]|uniref:Uncharacterized protein n=1 Tax=Streptomyces gobitricini TaxID=68211 RepID=A0ABN3MNC7_9ACTN
MFQVRAVQVGEADQQVVAVGPGQPRLPGGQAVLEIEMVIGVVVGGHGQELSKAFIAGGRGEDELEAVPVRLDRAAAGGDIGPAVGATSRG